MNNNLYEQLVARKPSPLNTLIRIGTIVLIFAVAILGFPFIAMFSIILAMLLGIGAAYLIFPRLQVEYEYLFLNQDVSVDVIYSQSKRKKVFEFDLQKIMVAAPLGSQRLTGIRYDKTYDFSTKDDSLPAFAVIVTLEQGTACVIMSLDEEAQKHVQFYAPSKFFRT